MELSFFYFGHLIIQLTYFFTLLTEKRLYRSRIPIQPALILLIQLR